MGWSHPPGRGEGNNVPAFLNMLLGYIISILGKTDSCIKTTTVFILFYYEISIIIKFYHYVYKKERKGWENRISFRLLRSPPTHTFCLPKLLFPSSLPLFFSLAVRMENSVLNSGVLSESRPVVLALIDLSLLHLLWLFPLSLHYSPPPLSWLRVSSGAISPSRSTDHESDSVFFSLFLCS